MITDLRSLILKPPHFLRKTHTLILFLINQLFPHTSRTVVGFNVVVVGASVDSDTPQHCKTGGKGGGGPMGGIGERNMQDEGMSGLQVTSWFGRSGFCVT